MKNIFLAISLMFSSAILAQDYKAEFSRYFPKDTLKQREVLEAWEKAKPNDAELYTSYYNYYFFKSKEEIVSLTTEVPEGEALILTDSLGKTAGYMGSQLFYDENLLQKAMEKIDKGIELFPDRLDMRFGKIYGLQQAKKWQQFTDEIVKAIQYSKINKNQWTWTNNEKWEGTEVDFLASIQDYQYALYNTEDDALLPNMRTIAEEVLKVYPNSVENLSNIAITYLLTEEYDKAIDFLKKAEKINPKDCIVLNNIAESYKRKGDKENAIKYYEKVIKNGNEQDIEHAKYNIEELKEK
ncbi:MAG: tetratricopeptide repeat protein [Prevotellaceae bacterium]|jgi:tetratricopeptide (TPR) repeat protein|nr:tetratricopeptide repeat protein [Prevotellaceae bacterium]